MAGFLTSGIKFRHYMGVPTMGRSSVSDADSRKKFYLLTFQRWKPPSSSEIAQLLETLMQLRIENMTCGGCVRGVTKAIHSLDPMAKVAADPDMRLVVVTTQSKEEDIISALDKVGFPAKPY